MQYPISPPSSAADGYFQVVLDWQMMFADNMMHAQRDQLRMLSAWQQSLSAINQDLWDRWVCRFGGGVPIDG